MDNPTILEHIEKELEWFEGEKSAQGAPHIWKWSGEMDAAKVHVITQEVEQALLGIGVQKQVQKRTFTILIEGLQNILIHSLQNGGSPLYGLGVAYLHEKVKILLIGLADTAHVEKVSGLVEALNRMDASALKEHYRFTMNNGRISEKGGAGLGLITMVMKSEGGMELRRKKLDPGLYLLSTLISAG